MYIVCDRGGIDYNFAVCIHAPIKITYIYVRMTPMQQHSNVFIQLQFRYVHACCIVNVYVHVLFGTVHT